MAVVKNLMVRAGADFSAITRQANKAKSSMSGMGTVVSKSCSKMTASVRSMGKVFAALGTVVSAAAIVSFSKEAKAAYDKQAEGETKLAQVMRNTIGASQEEIQAIKGLTAAQQALGVVGDEVQLAGAQELATYVTMTSTLETLIPTMNDMVAQQYGLAASAENAASIATMLGKVMNGQTSALSRYGYSFTAAQEAVLKYGTEAQRAAVLAEVVGESVGGMNAALAATPSGRLQQVSNTLGDIKENFGQAVASITTTFLPALNSACSVLANMATLANKVSQAIANVFGAGQSSAATTVAYTAGASTAMEDLTESTTEAGNAAKKLGSYGFDTLQKMGGATNAVSGSGTGDAGGDAGMGGVIAESAEGAGEATESIGWLEKGLARLKETADKIDFSKTTGALERLKTAAEPLTSTLFGGLKWAYNNVLEPLAQWTVESALPDFLGMLASSAAACGPALTKLGSALAPLVSGAFEGLKWGYDNVLLPLWTWGGSNLLPAFLDVLSSAAMVLTSVLTALQPVGTWLWTELLQPLASWTGDVVIAGLKGISNVLAGVSTWLQEHPGTVAAVSEAVIRYLEYLKTSFFTMVEYVKNVFSLGFAVVKGAITGCWDDAKIAWSNCAEWFSSIVIVPLQNGFMFAWSMIKSIWGSASSWFTTNVMTPITNGFKGFANGIIGLFEGLVNGAISGVNAIVGALNKISFDIPAWVPVIGGKKFGFALPTMGTISLPRLAEGAVFPGGHPYAAIVNDQKHGVNVETPLATMIEAMMTALRATDFGSDIQVNVRAIFDGQLAALARLLRPYFEADAQRVGQQASTAKGVL